MGLIQVDLIKLKETDPAAYGLTRASLIQKLIRRSMLPEALWVVKLFLEDGHEKGLKKRLLQIAAEDVGLSQPEAINFIYQEPDPYKWVALLCLAPKNREVDQFLLNVAYRKEAYQNSDSQTQKEISVLEHLIKVSGKWFENKRIKQNLVDFKDAVKYLSTFAGDLAPTVLLAGDIYIELSRANVHGARVMLALIALLATRKIDKQPLPDLSNLPQMQELKLVPDFALDQHTPAGRMMNRGFDHWVKVGAVVTPKFDYPSMFDAKGQEKYPLLPLIPFLQALK
jgi:hypothetical protein